MGRKFVVGGNWKMNGDKNQINEIVNNLKKGPLDPNVEVTNTFNYYKLNINSFMIEMITNYLHFSIIILHVSRETLVRESTYIFGLAVWPGGAFG